VSSSFGQSSPLHSGEIGASTLLRIAGMSIYAPLNTEPTPILQKVEVATFFQLPSFHLVGLPGPEVSESKERVRAAIDSSQLSFPKGRVVVNLSPADIKKRGTGLDLAVALGILSATEKFKSRLGAWGELGLDGSVKPAGQLTRSLYAAWEGQMEAMILCQSELELAQKALRCLSKSGEMVGSPPALIPVVNLREAWAKVSAWKNGSPEQTDETFEGRISWRDLEPRQEPDRDLGQDPVDAASELLPLTPALERLVGVVVSGKHHFLILGPRGVGKSQLVEWIVSLQPALAPQDQLRQKLLLELAQMSSQTVSTPVESSSVPVRWVGPQVRPAALVGGCVSGLIRPGEYSLANGGLLIADEFPEWNRDSRESLREPLERRKVSVTRAHGSFELPSEFQFIGTGNLCPCGGWPAAFGLPHASGQGLGDPSGALSAVMKCRCQLNASSAYFSRLSGPVLDRMDCVLVWKGRSASESTYPMDEVPSRLKDLREKVEKARKFASENWGGPPGRLKGSEIEDILNKKYSETWNRFLQSASISSSNSFSELSLRARHKIARVALSLSAWDGASEPSWAHWMEAAFYRPEKAFGSAILE